MFIYSPDQIISYTDIKNIIVFIGHPLEGNEEDYEELGMRLKKTSVSIDVINFCNSNNVSRL
jgi:hypothetical protein